MARKSKKMAPIHPGEHLKEEFMVPYGLSCNQLAIQLHVPPGRISAITRGERAITADTALRLGKFFGTSAQFWINLQSHYELEMAEDAAEDIERQIVPIKPPTLNFSDLQ